MFLFSLSFSLIAFIVFFILQKRAYKLSSVILISLLMGVLFGYLTKLFAASEIKSLFEILGVVSAAYVRFLKLIVAPLILVSITGAIIKMNKQKSLGKVVSSVTGILLVTTAISAVIGIAVTQIWSLDVSSFLLGEQEQNRIDKITTYADTLSNKTLSETILSFLPSNIFADLAAVPNNATIAVVIFSIFLGLAALQVAKSNPDYANGIEVASDIASKITHRLVRFVLMLTPYAIFVMIASVVAKTNYQAIVDLGLFVLASYIGLALIFIVHLLLLWSVGVKPLPYLRQVSPVLLFAFSSRSSAASIPLNVETQIRKLKNDEGVANFSASIGATLGQNGCAGLYPAMLAVMVAPLVGIDPLSIVFMVKLILITTISSFGIAGIGGGATNAALIVLGTLGLPIEVVGLLISVEPLIDMGRTTVNVNGAMTAGTITSRLFAQDHDSDTAKIAVKAI